MNRKTPDELRALKVADLKKELGKYGLLLTGKKEELIDRLICYYETSVEKKPKEPVIEIEDHSETILTHDDNESNATENKDLSTVININKELSEDEKRKLRAQKFGIELSEEDKKKTRAQRFSQSGIDTRQERFNFTGKALDSAENEEKLRKRRERFGLVEPNKDFENKKDLIGAGEESDHFVHIKQYNKI
ncbi:hypothetical protein ROZALSC1DRAFT_27379 [Rozella allomycis CSF55]|uniref:SAP domain-containing protein n=1 Tax=Rozella allomycis (strain CSF55) TaxID=988480 RepID=A0A075ASE6_ROZAC|nr:hypothetical protein O9G_000100 [Rozella allomycis CSF55]RKP21196.1 hypothetical protein ROZALSC1DRAFT_27379 [Rozella allomycis CSF55]|eukprot:EPZ31621.1 hypothetical protein O9G_000100 [Rozella allomycis CSF55]